MIDLTQLDMDKQYRQQCLSKEYLCLGEVFDQGGDTHDIALTYWQTESGHEFLPVFSDLAQLEQMEFEQDCPYLVMPLATIAEVLEPGITMIIDLESEQEQVLSPEIIQEHIVS